MLREAQPVAEQRRLRGVEQGIVGARYREIEVPGSSKALGSDHTPASLGEQPSLMGVHRVTPSARMF
jgi:hypothetical protein